jgi:TPR repeat protein
MGNALKKMSGEASGGEGAAKSEREPQVEEDAPASSETTVHPQPLTLLALVKAYFDTLVWVQLCNPQGVALFSFVRLPPRLPRPFAGAPVYDMSLTHAERLCAVGCGLKGRLVRLLSLGVSRHFELQSDWRACHQMMQSNARRVASKRMAAVRDEAANEAEELCASGQCAAAVVPLQRAIDFGDSTSRALKAWLLIDGREGVVKDRKRAFELAEEGARLGCHLCQGVMAYCFFSGRGCERDYARSLSLARESSGRGSRYGQLTLGELHYFGRGGLAQDYAQAVAFHRLAAAQGFDGAQHSLGYMYYTGEGVAHDFAEALRWYQLAASQGYPEAMYFVASCHENGYGIAADVAEAIRWYKRAQAAGDPAAADRLQQLSA